MTDFIGSVQQEKVLGAYAPRWSRCGWDDGRRIYTATTMSTQRALALAEFARHKADCPSRALAPSTPDAAA